MSDPSMGDRYLKGSGASSAMPTVSSQRSSKNRRSLFAVISSPLLSRAQSRPCPSFHTEHQYGNYFQYEKTSQKLSPNFSPPTNQQGPWESKCAAFTKFEETSVKTLLLRPIA